MACDTTVRMFVHTAEGCQPGDCLCDHGFVCPYCGQEEPTSWLLANNHWVQVDREFEEVSGFYWPRVNGKCVAQRLIHNHVAYDYKVLAEAQAMPESAKRSKAVAAAWKQLQVDIARAQEVRIDTEAIRVKMMLPPQICLACKAENHDRCHEDLMVDDISGEHTMCPCTHERKK